MSAIANELSRRGIQYGIHWDGSVVVFAAEHRLLAFDRIDIDWVEAWYEARMKEAEGSPDDTVLRSLSHQRQARELAGAAA